MGWIRRGWSWGVLLHLLAGSAPAQFDAFSWTLHGSSQGTGTVDADTMLVVGADGGPCTGGSEVWFETTTFAGGHVSVHFSWDNQDQGFGSWLAEAPFFRVGDQTVKVDSGLGPGFDYVDFEQDVSFEVPGGTTLAFGVWSLDCELGPGVLELTGFTFEPSAWSSFGPGVAGGSGVPQLVGLGPLLPDSPWTLALADAVPGSTAFLLLGPRPLLLPLLGGVLVPEPLVILLLQTNGSGRIVLQGTWPSGIPSGAQVLLQYWIVDAAGPQGYAASNGVLGLAP